MQPEPASADFDRKVKIFARSIVMEAVPTSSDLSDTTGIPKRKLSSDYRLTVCFKKTAEKPGPANKRHVNMVNFCGAATPAMLLTS
jgi:hypothetical protein